MQLEGTLKFRAGERYAIPKELNARSSGEQVRTGNRQRQGTGKTGNRQDGEQAKKKAPAGESTQSSSRCETFVEKGHNT